jgi:predicted small secreted protein
MKVLLFLPLFAAALLLSGCNTMKGLGEDISGSATYVQGKMDGNSTTQSSDAQYVQNPPQFSKANGATSN